MRFCPQIPANTIATYAWQICDLTTPTQTACTAPHPALQPVSATLSTFTIAPQLPLGQFLVTVTAAHQTCAGACTPATASARISVSATLSLRLLWIAPTASGGAYSPSDDLLIESQVTGGAVSAYQWTLARVQDPSSLWDLTDPMVAPQGGSSPSLRVLANVVDAAFQVMALLVTRTPGGRRSTCEQGDDCPLSRTKNTIHQWLGTCHADGSPEDANQYITTEVPTGTRTQPLGTPSPPPFNRLTKTSACIPHHRNCGPKTNGWTGSPCLDKASLAP